MTQKMKKEPKKYIQAPEAANILNEPAISLAQPQNYGIYNLIENARKGLTMSYLQNIANSLTLSLQEISQILHVSLRTLQRYQDSKVLESDISAKLLHLATLKKEGIEVFGNEAAFNAWLRTPIPALQNETPLSYLDTPFGFQLVEQTLGRIKHGIFA
jgi:putative toxin-antitoxin system antitoxin component (TIGR02293 family)